MTSPVVKSPQECWNDVLGLLGAAQVTRPIMKGGKSVAERDGATRVYVEAVDQLVDTLEAMDRRGHLAEIGTFLAAQYGRV